VAPALVVLPVPELQAAVTASRARKKRFSKTDQGRQWCGRGEAAGRLSRFNRKQVFSLSRIILLPSMV
jgi:hypothetical protein